jgi:putative Mg2+ transporter-C (MgtC) family protein
MGFNTLFNISLAVLLGGAIGFERQWNQGMAGLRTNTLVALGSACFVTIGVHMGSDRIAAQLVSGIGFLGAGVILHEGPTIRGLNTAATLWCAAATGALAGTGLRVEAAYAAIGVVLLNLGLRRIQTAIRQRVQHPVDVETDYLIEITCDPANEDSVYQQMSSENEGGLGYDGKRGITFSHSRRSEVMTRSCGIRLPQFISARMPSKPSSSRSSVSRSITMSGVPTTTLSRSASS